MMTVATITATTMLNNHESSGSTFAATGAWIATRTKPSQASWRWRGVRKPVA